METGVSDVGVGVVVTKFGNSVGGATFDKRLPLVANVGAAGILLFLSLFIIISKRTCSKEILQASLHTYNMFSQ